jgi:hypothetical protein
VALQGELLPVLPSSVEAALAPGETLVLAHFGGVPIDQLQAPASGPSTDTRDSIIRYDPETGRALVDLSSLPAGRYVLRIGDRTMHDGLLLDGPRAPVALIELHARRPPGPSGPDAALRYGIAFEARRTHWKYTIVPRTGSGPLDGLAIGPATNGVSPAAGSVPAFQGPFEVTLPNGVRAHQFLSAAPIALSSRSPLRLRLTGRRKERMTREGVLVEMLPVPGAHQLALLTGGDAERLGTGERFCSEVFVYV